MNFRNIIQHLQGHGEGQEHSVAAHFFGRRERAAGCILIGSAGVSRPLWSGQHGRTPPCRLVGDHCSGRFDIGQSSSAAGGGPVALHVGMSIGGETLGRQRAFGMERCHFPKPA
jgi:hypothetical protein